MEASTVTDSKDMPAVTSERVEDDYTSVSKLLNEFNNFSTINKAWVFNSDNGMEFEAFLLKLIDFSIDCLLISFFPLISCIQLGKGSRAMFSVGQSNLLSNKKKSSILSSHIMKENGKDISFEWSPFPIEMIGVSAVVPSPSGSKLLVVRNGEDGSPTQLEIWGSSLLQKEIHVPQTVHGPIYTDKW